MTASAVIAGPARYAIEQGDAAEWLRGQEDSSASLVFFSPPYSNQRTYGIDFDLSGERWVRWMRGIVEEAARVSEGLVVVNAHGPNVDHSYQPIIEWLVTDLTRMDGLVCGPCPACWFKSSPGDDAPGNGVFGSGGERYQRRDWEPLYCIADPKKLPLRWTDNTAFGRRPLPTSFGGEASNRTKNGARANAAKMSNKIHTGKDGGIVTGKGKEADWPDICNPGNVIRAPVGGSKLGHPLAHDNEAPMSLPVAERFVCWYANPEKPVVDPFCGSGTTGEAALMHGRTFRGCDIRESQVALALRRLATVTLPLFA